MSTKIIKVEVEIEVDLEDWMRTCGQTEAEARADAESYVPTLVAHGVHDALAAVSNGASLVGDLSSGLSDGVGS